MPVIVYILGVGHSGSTLLDLLLGSHSKVLGIGELIALSSTGKPGRQERIVTDPCDCGAPTKSSCSFWSEVDRRLQAANGTSLRTVDLEAEDSGTFERSNRAIYDALAETSGRSYIVDSSKRTARLERLADAGFDVRPIHILRSPEGVVASHLRKGRDWRSPCRSYSRHVLRSRRLLEGREHLRIRYETLTSRPEETIRGAMAWLGLDYEPEQLSFGRTVHHHLAGNHMRQTGDDAIRLDERWRAELSFSQRCLINLWTLPARARVRGAGVQVGTP